MQISSQLCCLSNFEFWQEVFKNIIGDSPGSHLYGGVNLAMTFACLQWYFWSFSSKSRF